MDASLTDQQREAMDAVTFHDVRTPLEDGQAFWRDEIGGLSPAMFLMPIDRLAGHGRPLISILLEQPDADTRANAERLYRERKPFATGFFHLWQQLRVLDQRARAMDRVLDRTAIGLVLLDRGSHLFSLIRLPMKSLPPVTASVALMTRYVPRPSPTVLTSRPRSATRLEGLRRALPIC